MMIIDEVQHAPQLLPEIKRVVDEDPRPCQYLLIGSARVQSLPSVAESLAGRVAHIRLRPFAQSELHGKAPEFLLDQIERQTPSFSRACVQGWVVANVRAELLVYCIFL